MKTMFTLWLMLMSVAWAGPTILLEKAADDDNHAMLDRVTSPGLNILGYELVKISDYRDVELHKNDGYYSNPGRGLGNGYDRFSCANADNSIIIAYGDQPGVNQGYDLTGKLLGPITFKNFAGYVKSVGETNDPRWSGRPGEEDIFYCYGVYGSESVFYKCRAFHPEEQKTLLDFSKPYPVGGKIYGAIPGSDHSNQSTDGHYRGINTSSGIGVIVDLWTGQLLLNPDGSVLEFASSGEIDISPTGRWAMMANNGRQSIFDLTKFLATGEKIFHMIPTTSHGHDGWAYDKQGREVEVYMDNVTDWFVAFEPETETSLNIMNMGDWGYTGWNHHMSVMAAPKTKGWILMSTYSDEEDWVGDQLFLLEIADKSVSRIVRLGDFLNLYDFTEPPNKTAQYFAEGFASMSIDCQHIFVGANNNGKSPLDLYAINLPDQFWERINSIPVGEVGAWDYETLTPVAIPTPAPTPIVTPTPTPIQTPAPGDALIDINMATIEQLETLPGIGPTLAARIVAGRPYTVAEDLGRVSGIGQATLAKLAPLVYFGEDSWPATDTTTYTLTIDWDARTVSVK